MYVAEQKFWKSVELLELTTLKIIKYLCMYLFTGICILVKTRVPSYLENRAK